MNNTNPPNSEQVNKPPERLHDTAGMMLRKAREDANLTHAAVGEALHLTVHYIKALENDDHGKLPGATFVKGYLRAYARFLKLDVNAVLASYEKNSVSAEELSSRTESLSRTQKRHDQTFRWAVVTAVIIVAGVAAGWWFVGKDEAPSRAVTTAQLPAEPQANRTTATTAATSVAGAVPVTQPVVIPAPAYASTPAAASSETAVTLTQTTGTAIPATGQTPVLASSQLPAAVPSLLPASGTTAVIDTTVTNSASMPAVIPVAGSNAQLTENISTAAEAASIIAETSPTVDNQAAIASPIAPTITTMPDQNNVALTVTPTVDGARQVTLISAGADIIQLYFKGSSWVEIDDGAKGRVYNQTLNTGDAMTLHGTAPFTVLLGDAAQVELTYNSIPINLASEIRGDKTARFSLGAATPAANTATSGINP